MTRFTLRIDDETYKRIKVLSIEQNTPVNKVLCKIIKDELNSPMIIKVIESYKNSLELINKRLDELNKVISSISKKQKYHYDLSLQHFVNQGYFENANPTKDKCYQELLDNYKDKFNE